MQEMQKTWVRSLGQEDSLKKEIATYSSILAWRWDHGQRRLMGYSPQGLKESDAIERYGHYYNSTDDHH